MSGIFGLSSYNDQNLEGLIPDKTREAFREYGYFGGGYSFRSLVQRIDYSNDTTTASLRGNFSIQMRYVTATGNSNFGYFGGGNSGGANELSIIQRMDYSNDISAPTLRGALSAAKRYCASTGNNNFGYFGGGSNPSIPSTFSTAERVNYSNDLINPSIRGPLSIARTFLTATGNSNFGYFGGGQTTGPTNISTVDRLTYSNDTNVLLSRTQLLGRLTNKRATGNSNFGYFGGGYSPGADSRIYRIDYANDTAAVSQRTLLSLARHCAAATGNSNFGYFGGGATSVPQPQVSTVDRIDYSNDTATVSVRGPLSVITTTHGATSSHSFGGSPISQYGVFAKPFGYFGGGGISGPTILSSVVDRIDYSSDTASTNRRGNLNISRTASTGTSNFSYGWNYLGYTGSVNISSVDRMDFSNDNVDFLKRSNFLVARRQSGSSGNLNYGWVVGGYSTIQTTIVDRIDYSNDTIPPLPRGNLNISDYVLTGSGTENFGYYSGGVVNPSTIIRIQYSNDTTGSISRNNLLTGRTNTGCIGNQNFAYWAGGGGPVSTVERLDYSNDTSLVSARGSLSNSIARCSGTGNSNFGYVGGGGLLPGTPTVSIVNRIDYANDTAIATIRGSLSIGREYMSTNSPTSFGGATDFKPTQQFFDIQSMRRIEDTTSASVKKRALGSYGYFTNGDIGGNVYLTTVDRIDFSNDTATASQRGPTVVLRVASQATGNTNYGYVSAGYPNADALTVERIDYSNDLAITSRRGNLTQFHLYGCSLGLGNNNFGYFAGGAGPGTFSTVDRIDYSNDSATARARGPLVAPKTTIAGAGVGNANFGYIGGGNVPSLTPSLVSSVERINYANDLSKTSIRGPLSTTRNGSISATGNSNFGYYLGGGLPVTSIVDRIDYANDTSISSVRGPLLSGVRDNAATGNSNFGYIGSGSIQKYNYSNDTATISGPLSRSRLQLGSTTNSRNS